MTNPVETLTRDAALARLEGSVVGLPFEGARWLFDDEFAVELGQAGKTFMTSRRGRAVLCLPWAAWQFLAGDDVIRYRRQGRHDAQAEDLRDLEPLKGQSVERLVLRESDLALALIFNDGWT